MRRDTNRDDRKNSNSNSNSGRERKRKSSSLDSLESDITEQMTKKETQEK